MAYDKNIMLGHVTSGERTSGRSRGALNGLLQALDVGSARLANILTFNLLRLLQVQEELDAIAVEDAKAFNDALVYVVSELPGLCYTGVVSIQPKLDLAAGRFVRWGREQLKGFFNSPVFTCEATVHCIASAAGGFRIGFIQDCREKISRSDFQSGAAIRVATTLRFPIGDSLGPPDAPFYGQAGRCTPCTKPPWLEPKSLNGQDLDLQMSDDFQNNFFWGEAPSSTHGDFTSTFASGTYLRQQKFTVWLARSDGAFRPTTDPRLLRQIDYVNYTHLSWDDGGRVTVDTRPSNYDPVKVNRAAERRPAVSASIMPPEEWEIRLSSSDNFVPATRP